ncbi:sensor domain-containing protein [Microbacterium sp. SORGH_AS_0888]|uniref:variant leucine-rich repeat-containing protein n=1 Tax=Microbacterium sp. SORGH_AS_0888 TaxID=3041791 RepID=UPI0027D8B4A2|nr:sensor domain-containing protein [Microbacterium sp. SORGH_AS_0888]
MPIERDAAWRMLHDPVTDAAALAEIAAAYPEFAEAVARHPNAYPELIAWANGIVSPVSAPDASPAPAASPEIAPRNPFAEPNRPAGRRAPRWAVIGGAVAAGVLVLGGAGWAAAALLPTLWGGGGDTSSPTDAAAGGTSPAPTRTLPGDPVYIGDELDWFLLDDAQRNSLSPGGSQTEKDASYLTSGESEGAATDVRACIRWILTDDNSIVGVRRATWQVNGATDRAIWSALQFPTDAQAEAYYRSFAETVAGCSRFQLLSGSTAYRTFTLELAAGATDDGSYFVVRETDDDGKTTRALAREGNVIVVVSVPDSSAAVDAAAYGKALTDLTTQARARLTDEIGYR